MTPTVLSIPAAGIQIITFHGVHARRPRDNNFYISNIISIICITSLLVVEDDGGRGGGGGMRI